MKRYYVAILLVAGALGLTGCLGRGQATPTATPLPLPTATAPVAAGSPTAAATAGVPATAAAPSATVAPTQAPTNTPEASPTASAVPDTATPTVPPTPDPNEAVGDVVYQDKLDGTGGWFWTFSDDVATFGVVDGKLKGTMKAANSGWRFTISPDTAQLGGQQASLNAHTVSCGDNDEYGLMFRLKSNPDNSFDGYLFKLRCSGAASFQVVNGTHLTTIVDWTPSPAIHTGAAADNTLLVWADGTNFRFYANGQYLFSAQDSSLTAGFFGIYLYDRTAGGETANFDSLVAKTLTK